VSVTLKPGTRLRSQVDATEVVVVRPPAADATISCGGHPMIDMSATPAEGLAAVPGSGGTQVGKRYTSPDDDKLELLVTKPGGSALALGATELVLKDAKPLPASD
jgi:hypothetical protein